MAIGGEEVLEAPDELKYLLRSGTYFETALRHVKQWKGATCVVGVEHTSGPWWSSAASLVQTLLRRQNLIPRDVYFVNSASEDDVPLACCIWRKRARHGRPYEELAPADLLSEWRKDPMLEYPELVQRVMFVSGPSLESNPLLLQFPDNMKEIAAVGSLYWNQNNTRIQALVEILIELSLRYVQGGRATEARRIFQYANSHSYLGYVVPARHSGVRAAIGRYSRLLAVAADAGLAVPKPLAKEDFLPGSVGDYWNPYHYPIQSWAKSQRPVGTPWAFHPGIGCSSSPILAFL